jgi:hypothetical protein
MTFRIRTDRTGYSLWQVGRDLTSGDRGGFITCPVIAGE